MSNYDPTPEQLARLVANLSRPIPRSTRGRSRKRRGPSKADVDAEVDETPENVESPEADEPEGQ